MWCSVYVCCPKELVRRVRAVVGSNGLMYMLCRSLGLTLLEAATGRYPYDAAGGPLQLMIQVIMQHLLSCSSSTAAMTVHPCLQPPVHRVPWYNQNERGNLEMAHQKDMKGGTSCRMCASCITMLHCLFKHGICLPSSLHLVHPCCRLLSKSSSILTAQPNTIV